MINHAQDQLKTFCHAIPLLFSIEKQEKKNRVLLTTLCHSYESDLEED